MFRRIFAAVLMLSLLPAATIAADPCQVHVVLFVPQGVDPPRNYQHRIDEIVNYTEAFFRAELNRWGYRQVVMPFRRDADGHVEVTVMRGRRSVEQYKPVSVRMEVMEENRRLKKMSAGRQVWWILTYAGDPPVKFEGFLGGFGPQIGGWAVCNLSTARGRIRTGDVLGDDFPAEIMLKGMIHELGHGFQLPHIGPLRDDQLGNTLMGPTHRNFYRVAPRTETRVYLSRAEAALLSVHPAFRGVADDRGPLPSVTVDNLKFEVAGRPPVMNVTGRVRSTGRPRFVLVADESDARPGEYWTKTYPAAIQKDGRFHVSVTEPASSNGVLKIWFAFKNGAQTGDGRKRGRASGIAQPYTFASGRWTYPQPVTR